MQALNAFCPLLGKNSGLLKLNDVSEALCKVSAKSLSILYCVAHLLGECCSLTRRALFTYRESDIHLQEGSFSCLDCALRLFGLCPSIVWISALDCLKRNALTDSGSYSSPVTDAVTPIV